MLVKNISTEGQAIPNIPAFAPGEVREVNAEEAAYILNNPNFVSGDQDAAKASTSTGPEDTEKEDDQPKYRKNK